MSQVKNPINGRPSFIKERLPKAQKEIKDYADEQGLITTTNNCDVKLFYKKDDGRFRSVVVNSVRAVQDHKTKAVHKVINNSKNVCERGLAEFTEIDVNDVMSTLSNVNALLKRFQNLPDEKEGMELIKKFCKDHKLLETENFFLKGLQSSPSLLATLTL